MVAHAQVSIPNEDIKKLWDPKKTLLQNYQRLGIAGDPNAAVNKDLPENERPVSGHPEAAKIGSGSDGESQPTLIKGASGWASKGHVASAARAYPPSPVC